MAEGTGTTDGRRPRVAKGRPNWWVILAVSLALMALLVATADNPKRVTGGVHGPGLGLAPSQSSDSRSGRAGPAPAAPTSRSTTTTAVAAHTGATALASTHSPTVGPAGAPGSAVGGAPASGLVTTTTVPPTTTTTVVATPPAGTSQHQGVIEPPAQRSSSVGFTGTGAMQISVVWSGPTYLTMQVSCPNGSQNVGGSSAMAASLSDASGNCLATVSEPASESTTLTYTITIGPAGG